MVNELLVSELKKVNETIEKLKKKKSLVKNLRREEIDEIEKRFYDKISILENKKREEINNIKELENSELQRINNEREPFENTKKDIEEKFKLFDIKENLNDVEIKYDGWCREEIETLKEENLNLIKIGSFLGKNKNDVNKYSLEIFVFCKNSKIEKYINVEGWRNNICNKTFKTKNDLKGYFERNYYKIIQDYKKADLDLFEKIKEVEINLSEEFDFNLIKPYSSHRWEISNIEKSKCVFIPSYCREEKFEVEYLGDRKFKVSREDNKDELIYSLQYSIYNFTPKIVV